jgi:hypothetical protein
VSETAIHPVAHGHVAVAVNAHAEPVPEGNVRGPWYPGSVTEPAVHPVAPTDDLLAALTKVTAMFPWPMPRERDEAVCTDVARALDAVLHPLARGRGAVDVAIGEGLDALSKGDRVLRLGYSGIADYAREELGLNASTAEKMARFARKLRERPGLKAAVLAGEVCVRRAEAVMHVAVGDAEEYWVARARQNPVRALKAMAKTPSDPEPDEGEQWGRFVIFELSRDEQAALDRATGVAAKIIGANAPRYQRMEALFQEYAAAHAEPEDEHAASPRPSAPVEDSQEPEKEELEKQSRQWASLHQLGPIAAPWTDPDARRDPFLLHDELRRLIGKRARWDQAFGHAAMVFERIEGWRFLEFVSFAHYCEERLGMGERTVQQRARLERRLHRLPSLARALRQRRISYEKARLIARYIRYPDEASIDVWIDCATRMTCISLRRALEAKKEAQMCARRMLKMPMPVRVLELAEVAFRAAEREAGHWIPYGQRMQMIAEHFRTTWEPVLKDRNTRQKKILERDCGLCQVPGCSRIAVHVHHIKFRSAGGGDEDENQISLCAVHHLQCVHNGWVRVTGKAPDQLRWQLGVRPGRPPLLDVVSTPEGYLAVRRAGDDESATSAPAGAAATGFASPEASSLS